MFDESFVRCDGVTNPHGAQYLQGYFRIDDERIGLDYESARDATPAWYAVSFGDGNSGVSRMHPEYHVRTNNPWRLAELAVVHCLADQHQSWARESVDISGDSEYCIYASLSEGPEGETAYGAAWLCCEVFPADPDTLESWRADPYEGRLHDGFVSAFGEG